MSNSRPYLDAAQIIWYSAPGSINRGTIFYKDGPIALNDPHVRGIPMSVGRYTKTKCRNIGFFNHYSL